MASIMRLYFGEYSLDGGKTWNRVTEWSGGKQVNLTKQDCEGALDSVVTSLKQLGTPIFRIIRCDLPFTAERTWTP